MVTAKQRFHASNKSRVKILLQRFPDYHTTITKRKIIGYLDQYSQEHMALNLRVLENINYFSHARTIKQLRLLVSLLDTEIGLKNDNVFFCSMSLSPGKSSDTIIKKVRDIAKLDSRKFDSKFLFLRDLMDLENNNEHKIIIFVDDFIGSGSTVNRLWNIMQNWHNDSHDYYIGVILGYKSIMDQIEEDYPFTIISAEEPLLENSRVFHSTNSTFTNKEKNILKQYCRKIEPRTEYRYGYYNTQSLVIFYENTPNNTIPILHHMTKKWHPLFPRLE